ncbi:MAG TPA: hypothetical protein VF263_06590 [Longimicrobiaceae bacterium]
MFERIRRLFRRPSAAPPRIVATAEGFRLEVEGRPAVEVAWKDVTRVAAYKRDLMATDEIMLAVESRGLPGRVLELSEAWPGFADLFQPLEEHLGVSPAWYVEIMVPAFEPSYRELYPDGPTPTSRSGGSP